VPENTSVSAEYITFSTGTEQRACTTDRRHVTAARSTAQKRAERRKPPEIGRPIVQSLIAAARTSLISVLVQEGH
jgi:hypothetical protein